MPNVITKEGVKELAQMVKKKGFDSTTSWRLLRNGARYFQNTREEEGEILVRYKNGVEHKLSDIIKSDFFY